MNTLTPDSLHILEVLFLVSSAISLGLALRKPPQLATIYQAAVLALAFSFIYVTKVLTIPPIRYPVDDPLRTFYLVCLVLHAVCAPVGITLGLTAFARFHEKDSGRFWRWIRGAAAFWILSAVTGTISAALLWRALRNHTV